MSVNGGISQDIFFMHRAYLIKGKVLLQSIELYYEFCIIIVSNRLNPNQNEIYIVIKMLNTFNLIYLD